MNPMISKLRKMKTTTFFLAIGLLLILPACATTTPRMTTVSESDSEPRYRGGRWYVMGLDECPRYKIEGNILDCQDSEGKNKSYKFAMSDSEYRAWFDEEYERMPRRIDSGSSDGSGGGFFEALSAFVQGMGQAMMEHDFSTTYPTPSTYSPKTYGSSSNAGTPIYSSDECIGAVVNGRCTGSINKNPANILRKKCYGAMINGECNGAIGY